MQYFTKLREVAPELNVKTWKKYKTNLVKNQLSEVSFLVVRHPFERLVSAYRDKLEKTANKKSKQHHFFEMYGREIVNKYRPNATILYGKNFFR